VRFTLTNSVRAARRLMVAGVLVAEVAQAKTNYQVDVWQADDGLPQGTVTSIAQTPDGYLWLGTQNGLVRFDGVSFRVFNANNTPAIKNDRVVQVLADRQGVLWVGAEQGNLIRLQGGVFTAFTMPGRGSAFNYARVFCDDAMGDLWVISCEWQLLHLGSRGFAVPSAQWGLSGNRPDALASDAGGTVCVGTDKELAIKSPNGFQILWSQEKEANFAVDFLAAGREAGWWVAGNGRLRRFAGGKFVEDRGAYRWSDRPIYWLYEDSHHRLWVATMGAGLFRFAPDGGVLQLTTKEGLPTDFVRCVFEDREGDIWVGTEGGGLCRLKPCIFEKMGVAQGLSSDQVMSVCEATNGDYWIGMNGSGIDRLHAGLVEHYGSSRGLMNGHVWSILQDHAGSLWAGTWGGLFRLDHDQFVNFSDGTQIGAVVLALYEDSTDRLWVGQQAFGVLAAIHNGAREGLGIPGTTANLDVRALAEDQRGDLWVGTENEGLYRRQGTNWSHFGKREGLECDSVWSLYADGGGLWIGTCGGGLACWRNGQMKTWTTRNGLVNDVICQILDDDRGNLWLGSYGGVFRVSKSDLEHGAGERDESVHCVSYKRADGLPAIECQGGFQPSGLKSRDGRLWFPTSKGFAVVNPAQMTTNLVAPIVLLEELLVDNVVQTVTGKRPIEIAPGKSRLDFRYTATSLMAPEKVQFKYRLEGLESEWQNAGVRRAVTYSHLGPGDYTFHVIAANNDGIWNEAGAELAVTVLPFFWQTGWFWFFSGAALLAGVFVTVRFVVTRRLHLKLARLEREQMVQRERARIAKDIHDDLGANLTEIAILSELAQNPETSAVEARADLRKIARKTESLTQMLDEIVWAVNPQRDTLENLVTYACTYAENFLHLAQVQCRLELPALVPDVFLRTDVRHGLFLVVKEALNNVVKHAGATEVKIRMDLLPGEFCVSVSDNGLGFTPPTTSAEKAPAEGDGLGNMRHRIENLGGRFELFSRPGEGTQVRVHLPIEN